MSTRDAAPVAQASDEGVQSRSLLRLDLHPPRGVAHATCQAQLGRQAPGERPEADTLDDALDDDAARSEVDAGSRPAGARARLHGCRHANRLPRTRPRPDGPNGPSMALGGSFVTVDTGRGRAIGAAWAQERGPPGPLPKRPEATR
jgi:hypothetical protein